MVGRTLKWKVLLSQDISIYLRINYHDSGNLGTSIFFTRKDFLFLVEHTVLIYLLVF